MIRRLPFPAALLFVLAAVALGGCQKELTCPQGQAACGGACVSLLSDAANCGACGKACGERAACSAGACGCAPGSTACGPACVDLGSDPAHCGTCAIACLGDTPFCAPAAAEVLAGGALVAPLAACASGCGSLTACGHACVDTARDPYHCGDCGTACAAGQSCRAGACRSDLQVACGATDQVVPVDAALAAAGPARTVTAGLTVLAVGGSTIYTGSGYPVATVDLLSLDARATAPLAAVPLAGSDLEGIALHDNVLFVANAAVGTLAVLSQDGTLLDEIPLGDQQTGPNPHGLAFAGGRAFVALYGSDGATGQAVGVVDLAGLQACADPADLAPACGTGGACATGRHCVDGACRRPCGTWQKAIDLTAVPGAFDAPGKPFPSRALAVGGKIYLTLSNLEYVDLGGGFAGWFKPAGHGRLAVIDTARGDAVSTINLGAGCGNPSGLAVDGATLWVACGSLSFAADWPGAITPVNLATGTAPRPSPPAVVATGAVAPAGVVICNGTGYVPDMSSGKVLPFAPSTGAPGTAVEVCPAGPYGYTWVSDLACAP